VFEQGTLYQMKIGIYFTAGKNDGGVYQYAISFLDSLAKIPKQEYYIISTSLDLPENYRHQDRFTIVDLSETKNAQAHFAKLKDNISLFFSSYLPSLMKYVYQFHLFSLVQLVIWYFQRTNIKTIDDLSLDVIIFPAASDLAYLVKTPIIVAVHDLEHRLNPQFPEVSLGGRWEYRENSYSKICRKALKILVDSPVGKEDAINCYGISPNKIVVLPYLAPNQLNASMTHQQAQKILKPYKITKPYIYYPAKFWPHKNHLHLVKALYILHKLGKKVSLVLTGAKDAEFGTFNIVMGYVNKHGLKKFVHYLGYVDNQTISALYKESLALVMPTFFGPSNIPIIEAWKMGTPVITSDIRGCRDQVGEAGLVADPNREAEIAEKISQLLSNLTLRQKLIKSGKNKILAWQQKDFAFRVEKTLYSIKHDDTPYFSRRSRILH